MKKKAFILSSLLVLSLAACSSSQSVPPSQPASVEQKDSAEAETEVEDAKEETQESTANEITIPDGEIFNQDGIKISTTGYDPDGFWGPAIKLLIENDSEKNITVQARNGSVNGYMIDYQMSCDVIPGKKANDTLEISRSQLESSGIDTLADLEFSFHIFDSESWDTIIDSDIIHIATSAAEGHTQAYDDSGDVLYDGNNVRIISKGLMVDDILGPRFYLYIENNSDQNITVQARDTSVNGFMIDPSISAEVLAGKKIFDDMTFLSTQLEENNITDINEIETSFHIFASDSWDTIVDTDPIVISFE